MSRPIKLLTEIHSRKELWKIAVKVKDKWNVYKDGKQSFEVLVVDSEGNDILVIVPPELNANFDKKIVENNSYCFENFQVLKNQDQFKVSQNQYKLRFNGSTLLYDVNVHQIPDTTTNFKDFVEILSGKWREDVLYDVIGLLDEIGYSQTMKGTRKIQVNFKLRDLSDNKISCTLWEDYAMKFITYTREKCDAGPTIIVMKYAKIKPEGQYPLTVSNTWSTTKLFINDDIKEIVEFKKRLELAISEGTFEPIVDTPSQLMSQYSGGSQYTPEQKFLHKCELMPLSKVVNLTMDSQVVTVVDTVCVKTSKNGWYFQGCFHCPKTAVGDKPPYKCEAGHETETQIWKYRLDMEVVYSNTESVFTFWDRECTQMLGISASDLRDKMIAVGIADPRNYPVEIDKMEGRTLAARIKWQFKWKNASVNQIHEGKEFIADLKSRFASAQDSKTDDSNNDKPTADPTLQEITTSQSVENTQDVVIPTVSLSDEIDPDQVSMITPSKRTATSIKKEIMVEETQDLIGSKMSSTKSVLNKNKNKHAKN
ncbi:hypothetical protein QL285_007647 [Trifolium repens]|nr:hypothetical protein QL285_007647 [Trifolium repens]